MTSQPSETRTVRNIYGVLRTVRSHGTYNYRFTTSRFILFLWHAQLTDFLPHGPQLFQFPHFITIPTIQQHLGKYRKLVNEKLQKVQNTK